MSKVIRLSDQSLDYIENFKEYSRGLDIFLGNEVTYIDSMTESSVIEYMLSYAVKIYRDRYDKAKELYDLNEE